MAETEGQEAPAAEEHEETGSSGGAADFPTIEVVDQSDVLHHHATDPDSDQPAHEPTAGETSSEPEGQAE